VFSNFWAHPELRDDLPRNIDGRRDAARILSTLEPGIVPLEHGLGDDLIARNQVSKIGSLGRLCSPQVLLLSHAKLIRSSP
jgi:hypothetical protein